MPGHYDSSDCCVELTWKEYVRANYAAGWRMCSDGAVASRAKVPLACPDTRDVSTIVPSPELEVPNHSGPRTDGMPYLKGAEAQVRLSAEFMLPESVVQVLNSKTSTVHLYTDDCKAVCGGWVCGFPSEPTANAEFAKDFYTWNGACGPFAFCTVCFRDSTYARLGALPNLEEFVLSESDGSVVEPESDLD